MPLRKGVDTRVKLNELRILRAAAAAGSMVKAADEVALSQSAISKAIAELEHTLGVQLLERSARGVEITSAGRILLEHAEAIFDELRQSVEAIEQLSDPARGEIRIGTTEPMTNVLSGIIDSLSRRHPRMSFQVSVSDTTTIIDALRHRSLDVGITRWASTAIAPDLKAETLFHTPLAVMAGRRHRLVRRSGLELGDLMDEQWTLSPPETFLGRMVVEAFQHRRLELPRATVTSVSIYLRLNLLAGGRFLTILPLTMLQHSANRSWLRPLSIDLNETSGPIAAITLRKRKIGGALGLFMSEARKLAVDIHGPLPIKPAARMSAAKSGATQ